MTPALAPRAYARRLVALPGRLAALALALGGLARPARAAITDIAGTYVGAWNNLTFAPASGDATMTITFTGLEATISFDMDGNVFGSFDPPPIDLMGTVVGDDLVISSLALPVFGDVAGTIVGSSGAFDFALTNVPGGFITSVSATGSIVSGVLSLDYTVVFPGPSGPTNPAVGTLEALLIPEPGSALLLTGGLAALGIARRRGWA